MSTFGKVLTVLNVLFALGFVSLAAVTWGTRHSWSYSVFRHDVVLKGLPLDEEQVDLDGRKLTDQLTDATMNQILPSQPVKTQVDELRRRKNDVKSEIDNQQDENAKKKLIVAYVAQLVRTGGEREALVRQAGAMKSEDMMAADGPFEKAFQQAEKAKGDAQRHAIAHILYALSEDPTQQQRALAVVGLEAYVRAVDDAASDLQEMIDRVKLAMHDNRSAFETNHKQIMHDVEILAKRVNFLQAWLQNQKVLTAKHQQLVNARRADVAELTNLLAQARQGTQETLKSQAKMEKDLFEAERAAGAAQEANQQLEREIRTRELGR